MINFNIPHSIYIGLKKYEIVAQLDLANKTHMVQAAQDLDFFHNLVHVAFVSRSSDDCFACYLSVDRHVEGEMHGCKASTNTHDKGILFAR